MNKMNYDMWRIVFETHYFSFSLTGHLDRSTRPNGPTDTNWKQLENTVKMWIYGTVTDSLLSSILKNDCSARYLWLTLENLFRDNKEARAIQLENELRTLTIGDLPVHDYCQKLKSISDTLANVDSHVSDRALVMHLLNGLSSKFDNIINVMKHRSPPASFNTARSMLIDEEDMLKIKRQSASNHDDNASSSQILLATTPQMQSHQQNFSNQRGYNNNNYQGNRNNRGNRGRGRGRHSYNQNWNHRSSSMASRNWPQQQHNSPQQNWPSQPQQQQFQHQFSPTQAGLLGSMPLQQRNSAYLSQIYRPTTQEAPNSDYIPTALASAFNTMTLQDPLDSRWYMDTGATAHLTSHQGFSNPGTNTPM